MREMKFRAWDCVEKKMIPDIFDVFYISAHEFFANPRYIIQQYTGLKDNSDPPKEIYEGDIVAYPWGKHDHKAMFKIIFYMASFAIEPVWPKFENEDVWICILTHSDQHKIEIIGNIYENPELIK